MIARRIIPRAELFPSQRLLMEAAAQERSRCRNVIVLDGRAYRCARETIGGHHEGIHDALATHSDDGAVRW